MGPSLLEIKLSEQVSNWCPSSDVSENLTVLINRDITIVSLTWAGSLLVGPYCLILIILRYRRKVECYSGSCIKVGKGPPKYGT
jgi:hypothetical protein